MSQAIWDSSLVGSSCPVIKATVEVIRTVGKRNAGVGRSGDGRGYARDDFKRNAGLGQLLRFFSPPTEDKGIPALQADDDLPFPGLGDDQGVDFFLREGVVAPLFPDVDLFRTGFGRVQQLLVRQIVVDHHVRFPQTGQPFYGHEPGISGAGPD